MFVVTSACITFWPEFCLHQLRVLVRFIYAVERLKGGSRGLPPIFLQRFTIDRHRCSLIPGRPFLAGQVVQDMWREDPMRRPSARQIVARLEIIQEDLGP